MGRSDGIDVLLRRAEKSEYWQDSYLRLFKALSGQDLGDDLDAWKSWFRENK
jgi:hypothetical protein